MVTTETRNNFIVIVVIIAVAILISAFVGIFASSILQVADKGQKTIDTVGKAVTGNVSNATQVNNLNLLQFNKSMTDVIKSNYRIVASNNATIKNLTNVVHNFSDANIANGKGLRDNIASNSLLFQSLLKEQHLTSLILKNISKQLSIVPVTPVPYNPQNQTCNIYSKGFPFCILPPNHPIFDLITNKTTHK